MLVESQPSSTVRSVLVGPGATTRPVTATEVFAPATRTWSSGPSLTTLRRAPAVAQLADGRVLVAGESPDDPGRGWQVVIESAIAPGFVVSLIHLQEFDAAAVLGTELVVGDALLAAVGDTGTDCAHLHVSAWRGVISGDARDRVERGQSPEGYTCTSSQYAVPFELNPAW